MFRITPQAMTQTAIYHNRNQVARLGRLQNQASSGLKYTRASENPRDANSIGVLHRTLASLQTQKSRIEDVRQPLNNSVTSLLDANNLITRAKQIALQAPQSVGQPDRDVLVAEVSSMINRLVDIANSRPDGLYLYSGTARDTRPFHLNSDERLAIPAVEYHGSGQAMETFISESISVRSAFSGRDVFSAAERGPTLFLGTTGARPGSGTDSQIGRSDLTVRHTATAFAAGAGLAPGNDSAAGDTVIGPPGAHIVTLVDTSGDGTSGVISLNGGIEVGWTSADTNLVVPGPLGERIHVDTTAISNGFSGDIAVTGSGSLSTDGGSTEIPITFQTNQVVTSEVTGDVLNVDSSGIRQAGVEPVEFQGTADAITTLLELRDDLQNARQLPEALQSEAFGRRVADLERISDHLLDTVGAQSVALQDLDQLSFQNDQNQLRVRSRLGELESADMAAVIVEMQSLQTTIQFNYAALSIVGSSNLLDFLG